MVRFCQGGTDSISQYSNCFSTSATQCAQNLAAVRLITVHLAPCGHITSTLHDLHSLTGYLNNTTLLYFLCATDGVLVIVGTPTAEGLVILQTRRTWLDSKRALVPREITI